MTVNFHFSILYELHGKKPKRPIGNHFPQWNWLGGDHWFGDGPAMAVWQLVWAHLYIHGCPRTRSPETGAHSVYSLAVCERCASVPSPLRNVINPGSDRQHQIPGCHSKRSGKAVCSLVYFWLWNLCLLRNREGIHAEKKWWGVKEKTEGSELSQVHAPISFYAWTSPQECITLLYKMGSYSSHFYQFLFWNGLSTEEKSRDRTGTTHGKEERHLQEWAISFYGICTILQLLPSHLAEKATQSTTNFFLS